MNCPWLKGQNIKQCGAVKSTVVLSSFELTAFCTSDGYELCPVFLIRKELEERSLSLNEYLVCYSRCEKRDGANDRTDTIAVNNNINESKIRCPFLVIKHNKQCSVVGIPLKEKDLKSFGESVNFPKCPIYMAEISSRNKARTQQQRLIMQGRAMERIAGQ